MHRVVGFLNTEVCMPFTGAPTLLISQRNLRDIQCQLTVRAQQRAGQHFSVSFGSKREAAKQGLGFDGRRGEMVRLAHVVMIGAIAVTVAAYYGASSAYGGDREAMVETCNVMSRKLGVWAMPAYVATHSLAIAMCFPYAVAFEAGAAFFFGFFKGLICVFSAKVMGAALAFGIGRALFHSSQSASSFVRNNKYFSVLNKGVAQDGWKFVLLARFSPVPSYIINYGLAATDVRFFADFLLPTLAGGIPMILQNTSLGTLTSAATAGGSQKSILSFIFPSLGIFSGILISWRIKKYASQEFHLGEVETVKGSKESKAEEMQTATKANTAKIRR